MASYIHNRIYTQAARFT